MGFQIMAICLVFLLPVHGAFAQRTVEGTVIDASDGSPLIGASVLIKGTTKGTITDLDGKYSIEVQSNDDALLFKYVGYLPKEITVGDKSTIDVELEEDVKQLDEIIVVGYGVQKKEDLTGAVSVVSSEDIQKTNASSIDRALQGKASGVMISQTSGMPGADMNIRIRGIGSINTDAQPLVVVDGVQGDANALKTMNPSDIESIQVLKDASAAAIYGAQASNGVILIQTKRGKAGETQVHMDMTSGFSSLPRRMDILKAEEYLEYYNTAYDTYNELINGVSDAKPAVIPSAYSDSARSANGYPNTDWQDLITRDQAWKQNYYLSVSGGSENSNFMISGNYINEQGVLINTYRDVFSLKATSDFNIGDRIKIGESIRFSHSADREDAHQTGNPWIASVVASPIMPVYNPDNLKGYQGPDEFITGSNDRTNPYAELMLNEDYDNENRFIASTYGQIEIFKGFTFKTSLGLKYINTKGIAWSPKYDLAQRSQFSASLEDKRNFNTGYQWDQQLIYNNSFGQHNLSVTAVHETQRFESNDITVSVNEFDNEFLRTISNGNPDNVTARQSITPTVFESYLGRLTYDYAGKYLLTASVRRDGSSKFGPENRYGVFPAFSLGYKVNEDFFQAVDYLDMWKIRGGFGMTGNAGLNAFQYESYIDGANEHVYTIGLGQSTIYGKAPFYSYGNPSLRWEAAEMTNIGTDMNLFGNRLQISAEYYRKKHNDLLVQIPLPAQFGLSGDASFAWTNQGDILNTGFEVNTVYKKMEGDFTYSISANITTVKNEVLSLPASAEDVREYNAVLIGHSIGSFYGYVADGILQEDDFVTGSDGHAVKDPETGLYQIKAPFQNTLTAPGDIKFKDLNKDGVINDRDRTVIGKPVPDFTYGLSLNLAYKFIDLSVFFNGVQGFDVYNEYWSRAALSAGDTREKDENKLRVATEYWTPENPVNDQTRISIGDEGNNGRVSSFWIQDASYLRIQNMQIGFTLPDNMLGRAGMSNLRLYVGANNLYTFTRYKGYDPEIASKDPIETGVDNGSYPVPKSYNFGISVDF